MTNNLKAVVYGRLEAIMAAEKITRVELGAMSRELLIYVPESHDIDIVNRLLSVLTPVNRRTAILFFKHFLPWDAENDADGVFSKFGKMHKGEKRVARKHTLITEFLSDENNNIWVWSDENIEIEQKVVNMATELSDVIKKSLTGFETKTKKADPMSKQQVVDVILSHITIDDMMEAMTVAQERIDAVAEAMEGAEPEAEAA